MAADFQKIQVYHEVRRHRQLLTMCLVNETLAINLTQSWEISEIEIVSITKPEELKTRRDAILWYDGKKNQVYEFGG